MSDFIKSLECSERRPERFWEFLKFFKVLKKELKAVFASAESFTPSLACACQFEAQQLSNSFALLHRHLLLTPPLLFSPTLSSPDLYSRPFDTFQTPMQFYIPHPLCHTSFTALRYFRNFPDECAALWQVSNTCAFHFISPPTHLPALFAQCSFAGVTLFNPPTYWTWFLPPPTYSPFTMACFCLHHFGTFQITLGIPFHFLASLFLLQGTEKLYPVNYMYLL